MTDNIRLLRVEDKDNPALGGKAGALARLEDSGAVIPPWFVVPATAFWEVYQEGMEAKEFRLKEDMLQAVDVELRRYPADTLFAVRSSAVQEDSSALSFAGQFSTFLNITAQEVPRSIAEVFFSGFEERVRRYQSEHGVSGQLVPSVLVQRMVHADKAGVAFAADPLTSDIKVSVVSAVAGLGNTLVDGEANGETWRMDFSRNIATLVADAEMSNIASSEKLPQATSPQVLSEEEAWQVAKLARRSSAFFGRFQDIEWAIEDGTLYLLQSRPITTLGNAALSSAASGNASTPGEPVSLFDNSNIVESYGGVTTPLTFSFIRLVYEHVYRELCRVFKVSSKVMAENEDIFGNFLGLIRGRVYYNLLSWYALLSMLPGFTSNQRFMEQMMGVKEALPPELFPVKALDWRKKLGLLRSACSMLAELHHLPRTTQRFYERLDKALAPRDLSLLTLSETKDYYEELRSQLLHRWDAPLINDFWAMIAYGLLGSLCQRELGDANIHNDLLCGEGGMVSAEPAQRIKEMALLIRDDEAFIALLADNEARVITRRLQEKPALAAAVDAYLERFSNRCLEELKLETDRLKENPLPLYRSIAAYARRLRGNTLSSTDAVAVRREAEAKVAATLKGKPLKRLMFNFVLRQARFVVKNRENMRFERTRLFGRVREIMLQFGFLLTSYRVMEDPKDIFYLEIDEIMHYIEGRGTTANLSALAALRKAEYQIYREEAPPESRFFAYGAVPIGNNYRQSGKKNTALKTDAVGAEDYWKGLGACPGIVEATVRLIRDPRNAELKQGEILVAEHTDPGWIMLFPAAAGVLVERGSLLSHAAIVSRELGIPAIVSLQGITADLQSGDRVQMNGATGEVRRIARIEQ